MRGTAGVRIVGPAWLWGYRLEGYFDAAKLIVRPSAGGGHSVQTLERYVRRRRPLLVDSLMVIEADGREAAGLGSLATFVDDEVESGVHARINAPAQTTSGDRMVDLVVAHQLAMVRSVGSNLSAATVEAVAELRKQRFDDDGSQIFPNPSVVAVRRDPALVHRVKLNPVLLRVLRDPALAAGDPSAIQAEHVAGRSAFAASESLQRGVYLFDVYMAPLMAARSPGVWGFAVHRMHGTVIVAYGRAVAANSAYPRELFGTLHTPSDDGVVEEATFQPFASLRAAELATGWWSEHLDYLLGTLTDPSVFALEGDFDPLAAMQALLTVEQVFRRVYTVQLAHRDTHARRVAFFSAMDSFHTLFGGISLQTLFSYTYAAKILARLEEAIHPDAHDVLLIKARSAVEALRRVQDGFFLTNDDGRVALEASKASVSREVAAAHYLAMLRDATHGFSTTDTKQREKISTLLSTHTGLLSADLGFLAWLYLLDLLSRPDRLRAVLSSSRSR